MKRAFIFYFLLLSVAFYGQENQPWRSFFSYNDIVDIAQSSNTVYGAASSAMFSKSMSTNELRTITSVDGLKVETITAIHHSTAFKKTLVGNNNGLLLVVNSDNSVISKIDVVQEATVAAAKKKINHILEYDGKAYLSCDFGVVVFNLATLEFGDTYYLGPNGSEIPIVQSAVYQGFLYVGTPTAGVYAGFLANPNLNDYNQWLGVIGNQGYGLLTFSDNLFIVNSVGTVSRLVNGSAVFFAQFPSPVTDIREANGYMIITCANRSTVYDSGLVQVFQANFIPGQPGPLTFTCATVVNETLCIGTKERGIFAAKFNDFNFQSITPDGPERSRIFSLEKTANSLWAVYGGYNFSYTPDYSEYGISKFAQDDGWLTIPYADIVAATGRPVKSISDITVNPNNEKEVYFGTHHSGLLKVEDNIPVELYDDTNSPIENQQADPGFDNIRVNSGAFDKNGKLWTMNSLVLEAIKVLNGTSWTTYSFEDKTDDTVSTNYSEMVIDKNGTKWIPSSINGVIGFNETLGEKLLLINHLTGNLPSRNATCVAIDNNNRLWIGTDRGLRVLPGIDRFTTEDMLVSNAVIILEDGLAQELMYEQSITDIVVDGANNKWFATGSAGAFLVSPDGQETLFHFTKENSPLPSNTINDIEIDRVTGEVFFATEKGMVSYAGTSTAAADDLSKVYVFPNPVRPGFEGDVNVSGLIDNANIKITDIEGNLVYETTSEGGTILWNTRAFGKHKVASGVYMIFISSEDGTKTKVKKVMIIR